MEKLRWYCRSLLVGSKACVLLLMAGQAMAAPTVQGVGGKLDHKATITITGTGFGTKPVAAPVVWDDVSGTDMLAKWDGYWPNKTSQYNTQYRALQRSISPPHSRVNKYISGAHGSSAGYDAGYNVVFWKNVESPKYIYASWYQRVDDRWVFGGDNNFKTFAYSVCCSPYEIPNNWYLNYPPPSLNSKTAIPSHQLNDDGASLVFPDANGHSRYWNDAVNPTAGKWSKLEVAINVSSSSDGYIKFWENGKKVVDYRGSTDKYPGTKRSIGIGGYARMQGQPDNWRYFADVYLDTSLARVVLANNQSLANATVIENQVPSAWSNSSITASVNLGTFSSGQTAYLFVVDAGGVVNSTGVPVTIGGGATTKTPNAPTQLVISQ